MDAWLARHAPERLLLAERARLGCLPERLRLDTLCRLAYPGKEGIVKARALYASLWAEIEAGRLRATLREERRQRAGRRVRAYLDAESGAWIHPPPHYVTVRLAWVERADFRAWVEAGNASPAELPEVLRRWAFPASKVTTLPITEGGTASDAAIALARAAHADTEAARVWIRELAENSLKEGVAAPELADYLIDLAIEEGPTLPTRNTIIKWLRAYRRELGLPPPKGGRRPQKG